MKSQYKFEFGKEKENDILYTIAINKLVGSYIEELQKNNNFSIVFPLELIPMSKEDYKRWGFAYAKLIVNQYGKLLKYQEEAALSYLRFCKIDNELWEQIKTDSIENYTIYKIERRDTGFSEIPIRQDLKDIIDNYFKEYNEEINELFGFLKKNKKGCLLSTILILMIPILSWLLIF